MTNQHRSENVPASSARSTDSKTTSRALMITDAARMIFSAYRRDDFADPECFVLQLGIVLERYSDDVIRELSHPLTGIQRRLKKPPSIADIVEGCEDILDRRPRTAHSEDAFPPYQLRQRPAPQPGDRAVCFVPATNIRYRESIAAADENANPRDWKYDDKRSGIWIAIPLYEKVFKR